MGHHTITEVAARDGVTLRGPRGAHGLLRLRAEVVAGVTRLTVVEQRPPLAVMRAHHLDAAVPDLASVTVISPAGGILQGDRLEQVLEVGNGARLSVGTQSAVRVYRAPAAAATSDTRLIVGAGGYLEYLPDPWIPYAGSQLDARTTCIVDPDGVLVVSESVMAGRVARGERFAMERFESLVSIERPDGTLVARDCLRVSRGEPPTEVGRFGDALVCATLIVVGQALACEVLRDAVATIATGAAWHVRGCEHAAGWCRRVAASARTRLSFLCGRHRRGSVGDPDGGARIGPAGGPATLIG